MSGHVKYCLVLLVLYSFGFGRAVYAQGDPFYKGKTIAIVVGYNPGDAHDLWARAYARYMDIFREIRISSCATCPAAGR